MHLLGDCARYRCRRVDGNVQEDYHSVVANPSFVGHGLLHGSMRTLRDRTAFLSLLRLWPLTSISKSRNQGCGGASRSHGHEHIYEMEGR